MLASMLVVTTSSFRGPDSANLPASAFGLSRTVCVATLSSCFARASLQYPPNGLPLAFGYVGGLSAAHLFAEHWLSVEPSL